MRFERHGKALMRAAIATAALVLAGCVPNAFVYDDLPGVHHGSRATLYPPHYQGYPGYYGYPPYYAAPGYYGYSPYPPRAVSYDHDHRGDECRHPSHRDGRRNDGRDRHDRDGRDQPPRDRDGRPDRRPPGEAPATDGRCAGSNRCRAPATPRADPQPRGMRAQRVPKPDVQAGKPEARKELD